MIQAKPQALPLWFFSAYFNIFGKIVFRKTDFILLSSLPSNAVLLVQNHFSWWDGYWSKVISHRLNKKFHVMMQEDQLKRRMFLTRTGAFSVNTENGNTLKSMRYAAVLLQNQDNLVAIYPQGKIQSHHVHEFNFGRGAELLLRLAQNQVEVVFAAAFIDIGSFQRPSATIYIKNAGAGKFSTEELQTSYSQFYQECIIKQNDAVI